MGTDWHYILIGKLAWSELPFYSAIATFAGSLVVLGALGTAGLITYLGKWRYLWKEWFTSVDHKRIGIMYIIVAGIVLARALVEANMIRLQQVDAVANPGYLPPEHFAEVFSSHGTLMIFFMAMPFLTGLINYIMPLQIGARDVAFPVLNSVSLGLTAAGMAIMMAQLVIGHFSTGGWSGYPPYTEKSFSPDVGPDFWIWAVTLSSIGSTLTGINFAVTIYKKRAPGMHMMRLPMFTWAALCTSILMIYAMVPLTLATALLAFDRYLGFHFFTNGLGGNMMNFLNLFWLFGHPEVYIVVLPSFGIYSEVTSAFSSKRLYGYPGMVIAIMAIAVISFSVWLHHFFTMGQSPSINSFFGIATMIIGIPTGVKIYNWTWTMFRGRVRYTPPMMFTLAFMITFVIGGATGIILATPPLDYMVHNTTFLVAHFHNMLIPGTLYGLLAAYQFWFPKAFGFRLNEKWGRISVVLWVVGFYMAFMPLYVMGAQGLPRRTQEIFRTGFFPWLLIAELGAVVIGLGFLTLLVQLAVSILQRDSHRVFAGDPWDGRALEWSVSAPPPEWNFALIPQVKSSDPFMWEKEHGEAYQPRQYHDIEMPKNSAVGPIIAVFGTAWAYGMIWQIWWMVVGSMLVIVGTIIARSFVRDTHKIIPAAEVAAHETKWLSYVASVGGVPRELEETPANRGLARSAA